jgi:GNAT superfamily N-acetyltransferase
MDLFTLNSNLANPLPANIFNQTEINIRPMQTNDIDLILEMHHRLSANSLFNRYHSHRLPSRVEIEQICALAEENGRSIVAVIPGKQPMVVGMAFYIQSDQTSAEAAFLVEDKFQGRGIGRRLIKKLAQLALSQGIRFFDANVLSSNKPMLHLLNQTGHILRYEYDYGSLEMRVQLNSVSG